MTNLGAHFSVDINNIKSNDEIIFKGSNYRITVLSDRLIRFEYSKGGKFLDNPTHFAINRNFPKCELKVEEDNKFIVIATKYFTMQYTKEKPYSGGKLSPDSNLRVRLNNSDKLWYPNHPEARNFKSTAVSLEDLKNVKMINGLYSTDGFATIDDSHGLMLDEKGTISPRPDGGIDFYLFIYKRDFGLCLNDYFKLTGFPPLIPKYALGIWWNRDRIYRDVDVMQMISMFKKHDIPLSVMLLSEFWHIKDNKNVNLHKSGYTFNPDYFKEPRNFIENLHNLNIKLGINIDPSEGIRKEEPSYLKFVELIGKNDGNNIPFNILNSEYAALFMNEIIDPLMKLNIDFIWNDYSSDIKSLEALNYYLFNNYKKYPSRRPLLLTRNHVVAAHRYPVLYSGETTVGWDTLNYLPSFNTHNSNLGISQWSHDVGGFKDGSEESELYLRHIQFATFSPIFRLSAKRGPFYKREPWAWDIKTETIVREYCQLRYRLIPYLYSENYNYHKNGMPLVQPLYYINPEIYDEPLYKNEYLLGSQLLVAPITKTKNLIMNRSVERIYLPEGTWYELKSGKKFVGNNRYVTFYKDEDYPVFVKSGAIVPLAVLDPNNLNSLENPSTLEINVFPGKSNKYTLYEDSGNGNEYKDGKSLITSIDYNYMENNYTLIIHPLDGDKSVIPEYRNYRIKFRNTKSVDEVVMFINGDVATNKVEKYFDEVDFIITIYNVDTSKQLTINCKGKNIEINALRIINEDINSIISDLKISTFLKERIAEIIFSEKDLRLKRIAINKLKKKGLKPEFANMFLKLLEYTREI